MGNKKKHIRMETLKLGPSLSIYKAAELRKTLADLLAQNDVLQLNIDNIEEYDTAGLQLLCSAKVTADAYGKKLIISGKSMMINEAVTRIGISFEMIAHGKLEAQNVKNNHDC